LLWPFATSPLIISGNPYSTGVEPRTKRGIESSELPSETVQP
jgi:hypothetical protein